MSTARRCILPLQLVLGLTLGSVACGTITSPPARELASLFDLVVPSIAAPADTVHIGYAYVTACGPSPTTDVRITASSVQIAVWREIPEYPWPCPAGIVAAIVRAEVVLPPRTGVATVTVRFREPNTPDSVRTITYTGVATP